MARKAKIQTPALTGEALALAMVDQNCAMEDARYAAIHAAVALYNAVSVRILAVEARISEETGTRAYLFDDCVARENMPEDTPKNEGVWNADNWRNLARALENDAGMRIDDMGLNPADYGIAY